ncbi:MAG: hypothetical protein GC171_04235 [Terrimonas sp.]|nr:hypothetical protein [Terrimonas sp.]
MKPEMLEIVLTELLEEQKKETITNAEIVSIIKRLFEKIEIIEQQGQAKNDPSVAERIRAIQIACQSISEKLAFRTKEISDLKRLLDIQAAEAKMPVQSIIKHHFYFKTTAIIAFAFFMIIVVLTWLYLDKRKEANDHKASDIKSRYMKLHANTDLSKVLLLTDSLYLFAPDSMRKEVIWMERKRQEQLELLEKTGQQELPTKEPRKEAGKK